MKFKLNKKCPCCGEDFTLSDYIFRERQNDLCDDESREKRCKTCNTPVLLGREKNSYGFIFFLVLLTLFFLADIPTTPFNIIFFLFFSVLSSLYVEYNFIELNCYKEEDVIPYWKEDYSDQRWMIGLIMIGFFLAIFYMFFSISNTYKEKKMAWQIAKDSNISKIKK